jgi:hypothetical protein
MVLFFVAVLWGAASAQFLVQTVTSLIICFIDLSGLVFSRVSKKFTAYGALVGLVQTVVFAALFLAGNWITSNYIDFVSLNANSIASLVAFLLSFIYCAKQVPGKILVARLSAWKPYFVQAAMTQPDAVAYAKKYVSSR